MKKIKERLLEENQEVQMTLKEFIEYFQQDLNDPASTLKAIEETMRIMKEEHNAEIYTSIRETGCPSVVLQVTFCLSKVKRKMNPIFERPVFDSAREKLKLVIRQLEKPQKPLENLLYTCFKYWSNQIFSIAKQVRSADQGTSVFNECRDCHNKWRD